MTQPGEKQHAEQGGENTEPRRVFLGTASTALMAGGLTTGYGMFASHAVQFLYPANGRATVWHFVATLADLPLGRALSFQTPAGAKVVIARQSEGDAAENFAALSSVCPHLGCAVHWEPQNDRFFCPCHNGAFDASGKPTEGPPAAANQELSRFPLRVVDGLLFLEVPTDSVTGPQEA